MSTLKSSVWSIFSFLIGYAMLSPCGAAEEVVLPNFNAIGERIDEKAFFVQSDSNGDSSESTNQESSTKWYPIAVSAEIYRGKLEGFIAYYANEVKMQRVIDAVARAQPEAKHYEDVAKDLGVWIWRNEKARYTVSVSSPDEEAGVRLIVIWLDRRSPQSDSLLGVGAIKETIDNALDGERQPRKSEADGP